MLHAIVAALGDGLILLTDPPIFSGSENSDLGSHVSQITFEGQKEPFVTQAK